jgi:hypothetical protein
MGCQTLRLFLFQIFTTATDAQKIQGPCVEITCKQQPLRSCSRLCNSRELEATKSSIVLKLKEFNKRAPTLITTLKAWSSSNNNKRQSSMKKMMARMVTTPATQHQTKNALQEHKNIQC